MPISMDLPFKRPGQVTEDSWAISPTGQVGHEKAFYEYISQPLCAEHPACPWHVWYKNGYSDDMYAPNLRQFCVTCAFWRNRAHCNQVFGGGIVVLSSTGKAYHYTYDPNVPLKPPQAGLGYGGHTFDVHFMDERGVIRTNDLHDQGEIPEHLRKLFPVNAFFEETRTL